MCVEYSYVFFTAEMLYRTYQCSYKDRQHVNVYPLKFFNVWNFLFKIHSNQSTDVIIISEQLILECGKMYVGIDSPGQVQIL